MLIPFREPTRQFYCDILFEVARQLEATITVLDAQSQPHDSPALMRRLLHLVGRSDAVVGVLDGKRPHVMFEVGYAQALGHEVVCIARTSGCLPAFVTTDQLILHRGNRQRALHELIQRLPPVIGDRNRRIESGLGLIGRERGERSHLVETLAETVHDRWMEQRKQEGWSYGERRSDARKTHPGLVRYEELSDSEREYDRETALATLKAMLALGYKIKK